MNGWMDGWMERRMPKHLYRSVSILVEFSNFQSIHGTLESEDIPGGEGVFPGQLNLKMVA